MRICMYDMISGYAVTRDTVIGPVAFWFQVVRRFAVGCFHILCCSLGIGYLFHGFVDVPCHRV